MFVHNDQNQIAANRLADDAPKEVESMKIKRITEVGVAVKDLEKATRLMTDLLGAEAGEKVVMDQYQMRYRMCRIGQVDFELMEPIDGKGVQPY